MAEEGPVLLNASLMCADALNLGADLDALHGAGIDLVHCDVMDGSFVPNITMGFYQIESICRHSPIPVDVHLMIEQPERYIGLLADIGPAYITVHAESSEVLEPTIDAIRSHGIRAGVSLNPSTPVASIAGILSKIDLLQIMTVEPGFAGQSFIESTLAKVATARQLADSSGIALIVQVDGNINESTIPKVVAAGASSLVLGSSSIFAVPREEFAQRAAAIRAVAKISTEE